MSFNPMHDTLSMTIVIIAIILWFLGLYIDLNREHLKRWWKKRQERRKALRHVDDPPLWYKILAHGVLWVIYLAILIVLLDYAASCVAAKRLEQKQIKEYNENVEKMKETAKHWRKP